MKTYQVVLYVACALPVVVMLSVGVGTTAQRIEDAFNKPLASVFMLIVIIAWYGFIKLHKLDF